LPHDNFSEFDVGHEIFLSVSQALSSARLFISIAGLIGCMGSRSLHSTHGFASSRVEGVPMIRVPVSLLSSLWNTSSNSPMRVLNGIHVKTKSNAEVEAVLGCWKKKVMIEPSIRILSTPC
jgi:hypothetical protein